MVEGTAPEPLQRLRHLERLGRQHGAGLPAAEEAAALWTGVGFRIAGRQYLASMREVSEILTQPPLARVPHTHDWVSGIANVRGNLLPVMDLSAYLGRGRVNPSRLTRVLVIDLEGVVAGLLVDEVLGMRHLPADEWRDGGPEADPIAGDYIEGGFDRDGAHWPVFGMTRLARHPKFLQIAE